MRFTEGKKTPMEKEKERRADNSKKKVFNTFLKARK